MSTEVPTRAGRTRSVRLIAVGLALAVGIAALMVVPELARAFTRPARRQVIEAFLQGLMMAYGATLVLALPGTALLGWVVYRARRQRARCPRLARLFLLCVSCLFGLFALEAGAATWQAWIHRLPTLPDRFADPPARAPVLRTRHADHPQSAPTLPDRFAGSSNDPVYLVVIGESSAEGFPYHPWLSVGQIVNWQLQRAMPERRFEVDVLAKGGVDLEAMHHKLAQLKRRPDAMIIYCGHNEFQARYEWSRTIRPDRASAESRSPGVGWLTWASPLCRMIEEAIRKNRLDAPPPLLTRQLVDWPLCTPAEYAAILADFRLRLEAIVAYCERMGTLPILVIPPGNDAGFEPSRSVPSGAPSESERQALAREFLAARAAEPEPERAMALYRALLARKPEFAEAHYRLARLLQQAGDWDQAHREYILARDTDGLPLRCPTVFQDAYREVASRHDVILIDGPAELRAISAHGILDDNLFHDAVHPVLRSYAALSQAILRELRARKALGWQGGPAPTVDPTECAAHFGLDAAKWAVACERSSEFYRYSAITRYDPFQRMAWANRYGDAGHQIASGTAPDATGVPGLGCRPRAAE
jgi:tetratricopeptide (TPR) repeat protein